MRKDYGFKIIMYAIPRLKKAENIKWKMIQKIIKVNSKIIKLSENLFNK